MTLCIYHGNCADGFGAAWVVRKAVQENKLPQEWPDESLSFHAGVYQQPPPDVTDLNVVMVDFSYKRHVLLAMAEQAKSILIVDHHKSAAEDLVDLPRNVSTVFDMNQSGAMLAWNYYFYGQEPPQLLRHIQDRDLWLFKLDKTREIQANVFSYPYDFDVWDELMSMDVQLLIAGGEAIERKHHKDVSELLATTVHYRIIGGKMVPCANLPYTMSSDAGHVLAKGFPFAACYMDVKDGRSFSLRSAPDGVDVSEVARMYGGGGHKHAAGFTVPRDHVLASSFINAGD